MFSKIYLHGWRASEYCKLKVEELFVLLSTTACHKKLENVSPVHACCVAIVLLSGLGVLFLTRCSISLCFSKVSYHLLFDYLLY